MLYPSKRAFRIRSIFAISLIFIAIIVFSTEKGSKRLAGLSFVSAAVVVALQNFVASFFAYLYMRAFGMFEIGDIIKTGGSSISASGQVIKIGIFFTSLREIDNDMMFTGTSIEFPNNLIFTGGLFNHTKKNHLFWSESKYIILSQHAHTEQDFGQFCNIVTKTYEQTLKDPIYHTSADSNVFDTKPKYELHISSKGLQCKVRILVHFNKLIYTNNMINCALLDAHKSGRIKLLQDHNPVEI